MKNTGFNIAGSGSSTNKLEKQPKLGHAKPPPTNHVVKHGTRAPQGPALGQHKPHGTQAPATPGKTIPHPNHGVKVTPHHIKHQHSGPAKPAAHAAPQKAAQAKRAPQPKGMAAPARAK